MVRVLFRKEFCVPDQFSIPISSVVELLSIKQQPVMFPINLELLVEAEVLQIVYYLSAVVLRWILMNGMVIEK